MLLLIIAIILFIGLVIVHELGHFWAAKRNGVEVEEFGIFFPPALWRKKTKGGWDFTVNALPLGGFVKLKGEYDADRRPGTFGSASLWAKAKIMLAGVAVNLITAVILFTILAWVGMPQLPGLPEKQFTVASDTHYVKRASYSVVSGTPVKGSPAEQLGLKDNDTILAVGKAGGSLREVHKVEEFQQEIKQLAGQTITVRYKQGSQTVERQTTIRSDAELAVAARQGKKIGRVGLPLGQGQEGMDVTRSTWSAPIVAVGLTGQFTKITFQGLGTALKGLGGILAGAMTGNKEARQNAQLTASSQVSGPVGIFVILKQVSSLGLIYVLFIIAIISLTLAIMNVLPIPALDGGRLFVILIARLLKKPLTKQIEERVYGAGFVVLIGLIILITIVDVQRILRG